jgi:hypothetical protein
MRTFICAPRRDVQVDPVARWARRRRARSRLRFGRHGEWERVDVAVASFIDALQRLNVELNGTAPSETIGDADLALPARLVYVFAEVARMLRDQKHDDAA